MPKVEQAASERQRTALVRSQVEPAPMRHVLARAVAVCGSVCGVAVWRWFGALSTQTHTLGVVGLVHVVGELGELLLARTDGVLRLGEPPLALGDLRIVRLDLAEEVLALLLLGELGAVKLRETRQQRRTHEGYIRRVRGASVRTLLHGELWEDVQLRTRSRALTHDMADARSHVTVTCGGPESLRG